MNAADVMTGQPISVASDTSIVKAAQLMLDHHISGLPVIDDSGAVIGVVTEGDLLRRAETGTERRRSPWLQLLVGPGRLAHDYVDMHARKVGEVMTTDIAAVAPQDPLEDVVALMEKRRIKRVPVLSGGRLVGIVSRADLVRALLKSLTQETAAARRPADDREIRESILAIIEKEPWGPRFSVDVTVENGVVGLHGTVTDDRERTALIVAAETVSGVKGVRDHIVWVEPNSGLVIPAEADRP
jgi:CBS domain-containing protein